MGAFTAGMSIWQDRIPHDIFNTRTYAIVPSPADTSTAGLLALFGDNAPGDINVSQITGTISGTDNIKHKTLYDNKGDVLAAIDKNGAVTEQEQAILLAIAMLETTYMSGYDLTSKNVSLFNLNSEMIRDTYNRNVSESDIYALRKPEYLYDAVGYLLTWLRGNAHSQQTGKGLGQGRSTEDTLNYLRGGSTAFESAKTGMTFTSIKTHKTYNSTADYRNAIATIYKCLRSHSNDWDDKSGLKEAHNLYHNNIRINIIVEPL